jgi:disulfide bond formation protein DsbB
MTQAQHNNPIYTLLVSLEILAIITVLLVAFCLQFVLHELPCPLCLLQRVGLFAIVISLLMNCFYGFKPAHYGFALLFAVLTSFVALRQIGLHVAPGTGSYGLAVFGFHLYTWSFIISMVVVIYTAVVLSFNRQYQAQVTVCKYQKILAYVLLSIIGLLLLGNIVAAFLECGLLQCPDNPVQYIY